MISKCYPEFLEEARHREEALSKAEGLPLKDIMLTFKGVPQWSSPIPNKHELLCEIPCPLREASFEATDSSNRTTGGSRQRLIGLVSFTNNRA